MIRIPIDWDKIEVIVISFLSTDKAVLCLKVMRCVLWWKEFINILPYTPQSKKCNISCKFIMQKI